MNSFFEKIFNPSSKGKIRWTFILIIIFTIIVGIVAGPSYYNKATDFVASKTNNIVQLPKAPDVPFRLGLDLQGGTHLVYEADVSNIPEGDKNNSLEGVRDVIERRINVFGVAEPVIQATKTANGNYRIIVELAGISDVNEAIDMIGETPLLEFKEMDNTIREISEEQRTQMKEFNSKLGEQSNDVFEAIKAGGDFFDVAKQYDDLNKGVMDYGSIGWVSDMNDQFVTTIAMGLEKGEVSSEVYKTQEGYKIFQLEDIRDSESLVGEKEYKVNQILLRTLTENDISGGDIQWKNTELTGKHLKRASVQFDPNDNSPEVSLEFDKEGSDLFADITGRNIGQPVAIYLDGFAISVPNVNSKITGGQAVISGNFDITEAKLLAQRLNAGALPVPIELVSQKTVGASLGHDSISNSLKAGIIGLILIAIFMILYYRLQGFLAVLSLAVYGLTVMAIFKAVPIWLALVLIVGLIGLLISTFNQLKIFNGTLSLIVILIGIFLFIYSLKSVTLTLSGLAGFILSVGMAVDANVLIFERIKEEFKKRQSIPLAIEEGFRRAWPSIRDGNISTIFICFVLMTFGTGSVQGFGTTLFIGISVSMFSAIVITRNLLMLVSHTKLGKNKWLLGVKK